MADTIGGDENKPKMIPIRVEFADCVRIAFETERDELSGLATVYLPGSPDPWSGKVVIVPVDRIERLKAELGSLSRVEANQKALIDKLSNNETS